MTVSLFAQILSVDSMRSQKERGGCYPDSTRNKNSVESLSTDVQSLRVDPEPEARISFSFWRMLSSFRGRLHVVNTKMGSVMLENARKTYTSG